MATKLSVSALIGERLKRIHAITAFVILSSSRPVQNSVQSPTKLFAAFYSTLKTPISPSPSFETTPIASFLLNECGFSLHDANAICRKRPDLFAHKSYDNARKTLLFLLEKEGVNELGIRKLFSSFPAILRSSFQDTVKPKVEFLEKIGLTGQKLFKTLSRNPRLFGLSISRALEPRVCFLQSVLDPALAVVVSNPESDKIARKLNYSLTASVISGNPRILNLTVEKGLAMIVKDVEGMGIKKGSKAFARAFFRLSKLNRNTLKLKMENLGELGFTEEEVWILITKCPTLLGLSEDTLRQKVKFLVDLGELGFTEEEVRILITKFPTLLGLSEDTLRQKVKFLVEEWKLPRSVFLRDPKLLGYSIEKRLKPRLNALTALMMMNTSPKKAGSCSPRYYYLTMSSGEFHRKVLSRLPVVTKENAANP